jgi:hypothetical protein
MGKGTKRQERFKKSTGFIQKNNPFPVTSCGRRRPLMQKDHYAKKKTNVEPIQR